MERHCDVIIGGGGMVGLTLGLALAKGGLDVVVADPLPQKTVTDARFDGRVTALAYAAVRMFEALGIWEHLAPHAQPIRDILVTDGRPGRAPSPFSLHFDADEVGTPMGYIAENRFIRASQYAVTATTPNLTIVAGASLEDLVPDAHRITATLSNGDTHAARLAVAADGRDSAMRDRMGIGIVGWSY